MNSARAILTGPAAVREMQTRKKQPRGLGPREWFPEVGTSSRVLVHATIAAPAVPNQVNLVLSYQVKQGHVFLLESVVLNYVGAGFTAGSGDILWILDRNAPVTVASPMAMRVKGFESLDFPAGSFQSPWCLQPPEVFQPGDVVASKVITTAAIPVGAPNVFMSVFKGWLVPAFDIE
jgi:hypothetical protein